MESPTDVRRSTRLARRGETYPVQRTSDTHWLPLTATEGTYGIYSDSDDGYDEYEAVYHDALLPHGAGSDTFTVLPASRRYTVGRKSVGGLRHARTSPSK